MRCPYGRCDGSGWLVDEETRTATPCRCKPEQDARRSATMLSGRIPERFRDVSFDTHPVAGMPRAVVRPVRRYLDALEEHLEDGSGLWFSGPPGTGKTTLGMLVARTAIERGHSVAVYALPRLLGVIRSTFDAGPGPTTLELLDGLATVDLLHIDDVGAENTSPWVLEQLYSIVNSRYEARRAITLTTNLGPDDVADQLTPRTVSRLEEMCEPVTVGGEDHRHREFGLHHADDPRAAPARPARGRGPLDDGDERPPSRDREQGRPPGGDAPRDGEHEDDGLDAHIAGGAARGPGVGHGPREHGGARGPATFGTGSGAAAPRRRRREVYED